MTTKNYIINIALDRDCQYRDQNATQWPEFCRHTGPTAKQWPEIIASTFFQMQHNSQKLQEQWANYFLLQQPETASKAVKMQPWSPEARKNKMSRKV